MADTGDLQHLELVVLADAGERDAVVDLADLVQRARRVLGDDDDPVGRLQRHQAAAPGDALAGVVGPVLHHLLGRDVERHAHRPAPSSRPPSWASARRSMSSSGSIRNPATSITAIVGKMRRTRSGPPVAASSSAAANSDRSARSTASSRLEALAPERLDPVLGVDAAGAGGLEVALLVAAAGDVVAEHPAPRPALVVAGEQRHDHEALHRRGQVGPHELGELVGLALERERLALDLLVVLELGLEQLHHLRRRTGGARERDAGVARRPGTPSRCAGWRW